MNAKQTYLAWVRSNHPQLYWKALTAVFSPRSGMAGLGDDLTNSITPDLSLVSTPDIGISQDTADAINAASVATQSQPSTDWFSQITDAITQLAPAVVQTQAAENLLKINSQRASMGLPLYSSNGQIVTPQMLSPTSSAIARMESSLSGSTGLFIPLAILGVVVLASTLVSGASHGKSS